MAQVSTVFLVPSNPLAIHRLSKTENKKLKFFERCR